MSKNSKNILIATGIYPPEIGGPAEYSKNIANVWINQGYNVSVEVFSRFNSLPSGIRHFVYFLAILPEVYKADYIFVIDTFSAALPTTFAAWILGKKTVLRTGGDFLAEAYVERTGERILLKDFYKTEINNFSLKEKLLFKMIGWLLQHTEVVIWSTEWQKNIFLEPYELSHKKNVVIENYFGPKINSNNFSEKVFIASGRVTKWKNTEFLKKIFSKKDVLRTGAILYTDQMPHEEFLQKIKNSYAVIVVSLSDISPNVILDAIRHNKPFIVTKETGIYDRIKDIAIFVDPLDEDDIAEKVCWLSDKHNYDEQKRKIESFNFLHTWEDIASEYMSTYDNM